MTTSIADQVTPPVEGSSKPSTVRRLWEHARREPFRIVPGVLALLNGYWYKLKFRLAKRDVRIGRWFRVYGRLYIEGPGTVRIGDNCFILGKFLRPVSIVTYRRQAEIIVGDNVGFNGTAINAYENITVDDWCNIADAYIVDSSAHHLSADRRHLTNETVPRSPIHIESNVWISTQVVVLKGVRIGENSVIGACSLIRKDIPRNTFAAGNPVRVIDEVPESHVEPAKG